MIFFDLDKMKRVCKNNKEMFLAFKAITFPYPMPSKMQLKTNKFLHTNFTGISYMLNPEKFCEEFGTVPAQNIVEYIILAGRRCYAEYVLSGSTTLDVYTAPFVPTNNKLIAISNNKIYFKHE